MKRFRKFIKIDGADSEGCKIVWLNWKYYDTKLKYEKFEALIYRRFNEFCEEINDHSAQIYVVVDLSDKYVKQLSLEHAKSIARALTNHYPERLKVTENFCRKNQFNVLRNWCFAIHIMVYKQLLIWFCI